MVIEIDKKEWDRCQEIIRQQAERITQLADEVQRLKKLLEGRADAKGAKKPKFTEEDEKVTATKFDENGQARQNSRISQPQTVLP